LGDRGDSFFGYRQPGGVHFSYASHVEPSTLESTSHAALLRQVQAATADWHPLVRTITTAADPDSIQLRGYYDREPTKQIRDGGLWLIGDADGGCPGGWRDATLVRCASSPRCACRQWMRSDADVVISVGPIYAQAEHDALFGQLPSEVQLLRVLIDAPLAVTWERAQADHLRSASRERDFHEAAHARYRALTSEIPADLTFDSGYMTAAKIAMSIYDATQLTD
jgi:hypothetical protein